MGEYATRLSDGQRVKIGSCEELMYLRYDQREQVAYNGSWSEVIYRFPFPSEDAIAPGDFAYPHNPLRIDGWEIPAGWDVQHETIQFKAEHQGYIVSLPCPVANPDQTFGTSRHGVELKVHKNGHRGSLFLTGQKVYTDRDGVPHLVPVLECVCGAMFNIGTDYATFESLAVAVRAMADRDVQYYAPDGETETPRSRNLHLVADRVLSGYNLPTGPTEL